MKQIVFIALILIMSGCATTYKQGSRESGLASWYGHDFHGRKTSNGETYDMYGQSAAHKTLPFGTLVRVTDLESGRNIETRINDRGPFVYGRIIDLSYGSAKALGIVGKGVARVTLEVIELGEVKSKFMIQVGLFSVLDNANRVKEKLEKEDQKVYIDQIETDGQLLHRVRVGPFVSKKEADSMRRRLLRVGSLEVSNIVVIRAN